MMLSFLVKSQLTLISLLLFSTGVIAQVPISSIEKGKIITNDSIIKNLETIISRKRHVVYLYNDTYLLTTKFPKEWMFGAYPPLRGKIKIYNLNTGIKYKIKTGGDVIRDIQDINEKEGVLTSNDKYYFMR